MTRATESEAGTSLKASGWRVVGETQARPRGWNTPSPAEASELKGVYCPECRESDAFQDDRIAALTQEIATLRQQIGDVAERLDGLQEGDSRTPDWYHAASIAEEWVRALLQKGQ